MTDVDGLTAATAATVTTAGAATVTLAGADTVTPAGAATVTLAGADTVTPAGADTVTLAGAATVTLAGAATVTRAGSVRLRVARGVADPASGSPFTPGTRSQISSVSKMFVATAVLLMAEQGAFTVDDPIGRWFPGCPPRWGAITIHQLLTHTSGIGHWSDVPGFEVFVARDIAQRQALFQQAPLPADEGTRFRYSGPGYITLGHIVAQAAGQPYPEFLTMRILTPLGLTSTTAGHRPDAPRTAVAYGHRDGQPVPWPDLRQMPGTGDLWSTVDDVATFTIALHTGQILSADSLRQLRTVHTPLSDEPAPGEDWLNAKGYGYGVHIGTIDGHTVYYHPGDNPGFSSFSAWLPEHDAAITVLSNEERTNWQRVLQPLLPYAVSDEPPA